MNRAVIVLTQAIFPGFDPKQQAFLARLIQERLDKIQPVANDKSNAPNDPDAS